MEQLKCGACIDNPLIRCIAASTHKTPSAKRGTKSLASGEYKSADLCKWGTKVFINLCPTRVLKFKQCAQPRVDSRCNVRK
jgi:hypothetical protein